MTERHEGLRREATRAAETFNEHRAEHEKLTGNLTAERAELENFQTEKRSISNGAKTARNELQVKENVLKDLRNEFSRRKNRLETLRELEERKTIYAPTVQKLFAEQKKIGVEFLGTLADKLNVDEAAEKAVENLFGNHLQTVLVESESDARKTLRYLSENNLGRISVLVQGSRFKVQGSNQEIVARQSSISDFLGISDEFAELLAQVFPRETAANLTEDFDEITAQGEEILVNHSGDLNIGGKLFVGGKGKRDREKYFIISLQTRVARTRKDD